MKYIKFKFKFKFKAIRLEYSSGALTTPWKVLSIWKLVELDFGHCKTTGISTFISASDYV